MSQCTIILGNGFDLDLGLQTRFSDFAKSKKYWPKPDEADDKNKISNPLSKFLNKKKNEEVNQTMDEALQSLLEGTDFAISTYSNVLTNNRRIPTPIEALNCIFGGGVPFGLVANSYGRSKTGKSTWLYQMMALCGCKLDNKVINVFQYL